MPPWIIAPRSVMMSPNMLSVTITSNRSGFLIIHMQVASTWAYSRLMSAKSRSPISWNARSQRSKAYVSTLVLPQSVSVFFFFRARQYSKAYRRQRSTPMRVLIEVWIATSCGVPLRRNPPVPA